MDELRRVRKVWKAKPTIEGAGVRLRRAFGFHEAPQLDPFLLLDEFRSDDPADYRAGFPWHPHRGIETITYLLEGEVEHGDSLGNRGVITPGAVQWMTAGGGILHQEMPRGDPQGRMWGFQLWANLPAGHKMMEPRYREVQRGDIPVVDAGKGARVRIVSGEVAGVRGPVRDIVTDPEVLDVALAPATTFTHPVPPSHATFAYVFEGEGYFDAERDPFAHSRAGERYFDTTPGCACGPGSLVLYGPGEAVSVTTEAKPARFLLAAGRPLAEPIAWYGPIVMNTQEEIRAAFRELEAKTFAKRPRT